MTEVTVAEIESVLIKTFAPVHLEVHDESACGCGQKFALVIVSPKFDGQKLLDRHRSVNEALVEIIPRIHALSMKTWTPAQFEMKTISS